MLNLYRLFASFVYCLTYPYTLTRSLTGSRKWRQRLGRIDRIRLPGEKKIWLHASSMGEVKVLSILKGRLEKLDPSLSFIITVMTETGHRKAAAMESENCRVLYLPLDHGFPVRRFLDRAGPDAAVFIETEIWPNIIGILGKKSVPIFLVNGRLSEKSVRRYRRFRESMSRLFAGYRKLMVQTETDRERFLSIGAPDELIEITGSLKFDAPMRIPDESRKEEIRKSLPFPERARIFIAGSTRREENEVILQVFQRLSAEFPDLHLILVPRHLERIPEIKELAGRENLKFCLHTEIEESFGHEIRVVIVDRMGILNDLYAVSDIAFVGGTLADIGGHNLLEPVWAGIPVLFGPSTANVRDSAEYIIENRFGQAVSGPDELYDKLREFFSGHDEYNRKNTEGFRTRRTDRTARVILENIINDGKNLAGHNR